MKVVTLTNVQNPDETRIAVVDCGHWLCLSVGNSTLGEYWTEHNLPEMWDGESIRDFVGIDWAGHSYTAHPDYGARHMTERLIEALK